VAAALAALVAAPGSASAASPPSPLPAEGSIGLRLIDAPVGASDDPRAQIYIVDHLAPGSVIRRRVEISSTMTRTAEVVMYSAAAAVRGGAFVPAEGHAPNDLSTWTSVRPGAPQVPAGGRVTATVTIAVPHDAAPGEQYAVVWAEVRSDPGSNGGVTRVNRVGIRVYLSVGPGGAPAAAFTVTALTAERASDGRPRVLATVHNTGGRALDLNGTLRLLAGPGGLSAGPFPVDLGTTLAIGESGQAAINLDGRLPDGPWDARLTLRSGLLEREAHATITFPTTGAAAPVSTRSASRGWLTAAAVIVLLILLGVAGVLVVAKRRPDRRPAPARRPIPLLPR
jgi:hypothetical protein